MMGTDWQAVLLDLLNTTPVADGVPTDELAGDVAARAWLRTHGDLDDGDLADVRRVRDDLQAVVRGERDPSTLHVYLDGVQQVPRLGPDGLTWSLADAGWSARVVLAWGELQAESPGRLRPCANHECRLFLLDRTRAGTARWCSMSVCGNRMKARRHYGRSASS
jgi:hypothetical protein